MQAQFLALGWESQIDRSGNVIAYQPSASAGPFVALTAHLDTVLAPRTPEEITIGHDGRFTGPGISDNGSGLAALLAIAKVYSLCPALEGNPLSLLLAANVGEEGEGNLSGMRYLLASWGFRENLVPLANPLSADLAVMRPSLLPGLIEALRHNRARQQ